MADLKKLKKFLKKSDFREGDEVEFVDAGEIKDVDFSTNKDGSKIQTVFEVKVRVNGGDPKVTTLNTTTTNTLGEHWGDNTENWVGRRARVTFVKQIVFGKLDKVLCMEPPEAING